MSLWEDFLDGVLDRHDKPGKVMICFVNRYLEGMDGTKYKIKYDGREKSGMTSAENYCIELAPTSFAPIQTFVWSRKAKTYKKLDDVIAEPGRKKLVRKMLKTFKVTADTDKLPVKPAGKRPDKPAPAPVPAPSPTDPQGIKPEQTKNESDQPQAKPERAVPDMITKEQLKKIFPAAQNDFLQQIADECNKDLVKYHLDTPYRKAHFFAQIKGETGPKMKPRKEEWLYSPQTLMAFSSYYRNHPDEAQADGYLRGPNINGKKGKIIRPTNEDAVGKKHFLHLNENRLDHPNDGSNFRGRGLIQITGYEKYSKFHNEYSKYFSGLAPDSVTNPDIVNEAPYAIRTAIWFWNYRNVYKIADKGKGMIDVTSVTIRVNGAEMGLIERKNAYKLAEAAFK